MVYNQTYFSHSSFLSQNDSFFLGEQASINALIIAFLKKYDKNLTFCGEEKQKVPRLGNEMVIAYDMAESSTGQQQVLDVSQ